MPAGPELFRTWCKSYQSYSTQWRAHIDHCIVSRDDDVTRMQLAYRNRKAVWKWRWQQNIARMESAPFVSRIWIFIACSDSFSARGQERDLVTLLEILYL